MPVGCQKPIVAVTSSSRVTKDYDAPSLARFPWRRSRVVWSFLYLAVRRSLELDPALLPAGGDHGDRAPGATPRACGAAPPASAAPPAAEGSCAARGVEPFAPSGALVGVPGAARNIAALAPAPGGSALDVPDHLQGTTSDTRGGAAAGRAARSREPTMGLSADPRRVAPSRLAGVGQFDRAGAARSRS